VRASLGTLSVWTSTRSVEPYQGWACFAVSHHVSSGPGRGFAIRETVVHSYSPPYALPAAGRSCVRKGEGFGIMRSASSIEADRGSLCIALSHGSAPLTRSVCCSVFREGSVSFVLPSQSVFRSQLCVPCRRTNCSVYNRDATLSTLDFDFIERGVSSVHAGAYRNFPTYECLFARATFCGGRLGKKGVHFAPILTDGT